MGMEHLSCSALRPRTHLGLKEIKVRKETEEEEEPLSPVARMFHEPQSNIYVILIVGFKSPIDPHNFKANLVETFVKHPRFSSVQVSKFHINLCFTFVLKTNQIHQVADGGEMKWVKTKVDINNHVIVPMVDQDQYHMDMAASDKFVEDYVANLTKTQISMSIPMWDCHVLNLQTSDAESTLVFRVHHSLGDGTSLMSLLISCSDELPSFPEMKKPRSAGTGRFSIWLGRCWNLKDAKATMDRKKATLEAQFRLFIAKVFVKFHPTKLAAFPSTTMWFSNVAGPQHQISIFGNPVAFLAASVYGQPASLTVHILSYSKKINVALSVDDNTTLNPYELCDDIEEALQLMKNTIINVKGWIK
ncbi:hypothetical protein V6N12_018047 [Hibiscus sabdariffa]|uniref:Diacylglycerol O-acyltransferase n=1 Tax=Hibiscus sabdariffa TaxID=183260 RepID=A0ABR2APV4_9ROSI